MSNIFSRQNVAKKVLLHLQTEARSLLEKSAKPYLNNITLYLELNMDYIKIVLPSQQ